MPTGNASGRWVLDIDVKRPEANGFDTLEDLGHSVLPNAPMAHTESGGLHVYYDAGSRELKNSAGLIPTSVVWSKSAAGSRGNARDTTERAKLWC
jgi:hypothetical protein